MKLLLETLLFYEYKFYYNNKKLTFTLAPR